MDTDPIVYRLDAIIVLLLIVIGLLLWPIPSELIVAALITAIIVGAMIRYPSR